jgi:DNA-binding cell septation regulator SpoVG
MFWHIGTRKASGQTDANDPQIAEAMENLHARILEGRQGIFVNSPSKLSSGHHGELKCVKHCEFNQLCRINRVSRRKA